MSKTSLEDLVNEMLDELYEKGLCLKFISPRIRQDDIRIFVNTVLELLHIDIRMELDCFYYAYIKEDSALKKQPDEVIEEMIKEFHNFYIVSAKAYLRELCGEIGEKAVANAYDEKEIQIYIEKEDKKFLEIIDNIDEFIIKSNDTYLYVNDIIEETIKGYTTKIRYEDIENLIPVVKERCDQEIKEYIEKDNELLRSFIDYLIQTFQITQDEIAKVDDDLRSLNVGKTCDSIIADNLEVVAHSYSRYLEYVKTDLQNMLYEKGVLFHVLLENTDYTEFMIPLLRKVYSEDIKENSILIYITNDNISDDYALKEVKRILKMDLEDKLESFTPIIKRGKKYPFEEIENCMYKCTEILDETLSTEYDNIINAMDREDVQEVTTIVERLHMAEKVVNSTIVMTIANELGMTEEEVKNIPDLRLFAYPLDRILTQ